MSRAVIRPDSASADSADFADPAAVAVAVSVSGLVHSLDLGSSAYLLLVYISYFPVSLFLNETVLAFLTRLAVLQILYRPIEKQVRLRISM